MISLFWIMFIVWTVFGVCILKPHDLYVEDLDYSSLSEEESIKIIKERLWTLCKYVLAGPSFWTIMLGSAISILLTRLQGAKND